MNQERYSEQGAEIGRDIGGAIGSGVDTINSGIQTGINAYNGAINTAGEAIGGAVYNTGVAAEGARTAVAQGAQRAFQAIEDVVTLDSAELREAATKLRTEKQKIIANADNFGNIMNQLRAGGLITQVNGAAIDTIARNLKTGATNLGEKLTLYASELDKQVVEVTAEEHVTSGSLGEGINFNF